MNALGAVMVIAALLFMFVVEPWLRANDLLDGPKTIRHRPTRHVCSDCDAPWTPDHVCAAELPALQGELRRLEPKGQLERKEWGP